MANLRRSIPRFNNHQNPSNPPLSDQPPPPPTATAISLPQAPAGLPLPPLHLRPPHLSLPPLPITPPPPTAPPLSTSSSRPHSLTLKGDVEANLVTFSVLEVPSLIAKDHRGWPLNPITIAQEAGIHGGAQSCASLHVGEIRPGGVRGNHRHHTCNETFIIWGAETKFRLENPSVEDHGYAEVSIGVDEVAIAARTAHALINVDRVHTTFFLVVRITR